MTMKRLLFSFCTFSFLISISAQDKIGLDITMMYSKGADGSIVLTAEVYDEEEYEAVMDLDFQFISVDVDSESLLGTSRSNEDAIVILSNIQMENILVGEESLMTFRITGENETYSGSHEIEVRYVDLDLNFDIVDSVKILSVNLTGSNGEGVEDGEIYFFVPRLYGDLPIGEVWTDEDGYDEMKFPTDIPGDENGGLTVIARIVESDDFGSIEVREEIDWGIPTATEALQDRNLWSPNAPLWMVITFAILITGVFVHYGWVVINLLKIKKLGRESN